ncbi:MAG: AsmA family protein [Geminicoccaceae bacterium]
MRKILIGIAVVLVVIVGAAVAVPMLIPVSTYKNQIETRAQEATGRELSIGDDFSFSILPTVSVNASNVTFANHEGGVAANMVSLGSLEARLKIWPLIQGVVEVDRFVLNDPEIYLEVAEDGRANWQIGGAPQEVPADQPSDQTAEAPSDGAAGGLPIDDIRLGEIAINNGKLVYLDQPSGRREELSDINVTLELANLQSPLALDGSLVYEAEEVTLDLDVEQPLAAVEGGSTPLMLALSAAPVSLSYEGSVVNEANAPEVEGKLTANIASLARLLNWVKAGSEAPPPVEAIDFDANLAASPTRVALSDATLNVDDINAEGGVSVDLSGQRPRIEATLATGVIDLNKFMPATEDGGGETAPSPQETSASAPANQDWPDDPIPLPEVPVDASLDLRVEGLIVQDIEIGASHVVAKADAGVIDVTLDEMAFYGGNGSGQIVADLSSGDQAKITERFSLQGVNALPFLTDAAQFDRLEGTLDLETSVETQGNSQRSFVQNLNGSGKATFLDGAIVGINIAALVRNAGGLLGDDGESVKTDFAELSGSYDIKNGVLTNNDLSLQAPLLRVSGNGTVNIVEKTVPNYRIEPKAVASLEGQGGSADRRGIQVPVVVSGPWSDLSFKPDLASVADQVINTDLVGEDAKKVKEALEGVAEGGAQGVIEQLQSDEGAKKAIEGLLGGGGDDNGGGVGGLLNRLGGN